MRYGIFGCTADPFTCAHYEIVNKVLRDNIVDKVIVIPTVVDYYRKDKHRLFTNEQRLTIIKKWFDCCENVIVDDFEYNLVRKSPGSCVDRRYWHTLQAAMLRYGTDNEYCTIVGGDSWNNLESWFNFKELGKATKFIVITRDQQRIADFSEKYEEYAFQPYKVIELEDKYQNVSATGIRSFLGVFADPFQAYLDMVDIQLDELKNKDQETLLAHTPIFDLVEAPEVEAGFKPVKINSPDWVSVFVVKDDKVLTVTQLRYGINKKMTELPCGMVEPGEATKNAALRELAEETGYVLDNEDDIKWLGSTYANPAFMTNKMNYWYVNLDNSKYHKISQHLDEHEHLEVSWMTLDNFKAMVDDVNVGFQSTFMVAALYFLEKYLKTH